VRVDVCSGIDIKIFIRSNSYMSTHLQGEGSARRRVTPPVSAALLTIVLFVLATPRAFAAPAVLGGVLAEPDGPGARIRVVISGPFHYSVIRRAHGVVISLDGVVAEEMTHRLVVGPITGVLIRPKQRHGLPGVDVVVTTRTPVDIVEALLADYVVALRLVPQRTVANPALSPPPARAPLTPPTAPPEHPTSPPTAAVPSSSSAPSVPAPSGSTGILAERTVVPGSLRLEIGMGRLLQIDGLLRVAVSDPHVLGVVPITSHELLLNGRSEGRTTMYVWEGTQRLLTYTVEVVPATDRLAGLRRLLASLFPSAAITVTEASGSAAAPLRDTSAGRADDGGTQPPRPRESLPGGSGPHESPSLSSMTGHEQSPSHDIATEPQGDSSTSLRRAAPAFSQPPAASGGTFAVVLSGEVETQLDRRKAEEIASAFAPRVVNLLNVRQPIQFKLQVQVVELNRNTLKAFGVTWGGGQVSPGSPPLLNGGVYNLQVITAPGVGTNGLDLLVAQIQALEQNGLARILAEPSVVVLAGQSASLLLGGQVPIPISGPNGEVTLEYKDFGVILTAQPDYQEDGRIFLQITPEVSTLDFANAIKVNGFMIPALRVRRAQTVVSLLPTQTLVLGGLLQSQDSTLIQKLPLLGDLPIIGQLFRSTTFQHQDSDLVIFVTPVLIEPSGAQSFTPRVDYP
jgi:Flp pilus assembly secretin CpaC